MEENNNNFSKSYLKWLGAGVLVVIVGLFTLYGNGYRDEFRLRLSSSSAQTNAKMTIDSGSGNKRVFEGNVVDGMTILETLLASTQNTDIQLTYVVDQNNDVKISTLAGQANNIDGKQWHFYLNDKPVMTKDINRIIISPRSTIEAVFE